MEGGTSITLAEGDVITENRVIVDREGYTTVYTLPRGARRITLYRHGKGRGQLVIGGFKAITVTVNGTVEQLEQLRDAVL